MSKLKPQVDWFYSPKSFFMEYGLLSLAGKWAVVKARSFDPEDYEVVTDWVDDRKTAVGFLKLLTE